MNLAQTELEFAKQVTDEEKTELMERLPDLFQEKLPKAVITRVSIRHYTGVLTIGKKIKVTKPFRLRCTCDHGLEEMIIGQTSDGTWVAQKSQGQHGRPRRQIGR